MHLRFHFFNILFFHIAEKDLFSSRSFLSYCRGVSLSVVLHLASISLIYFFSISLRSDLFSSRSFLSYCCEFSLSVVACIFRFNFFNILFFISRSDLHFFHIFFFYFPSQFIILFCLRSLSVILCKPEYFLSALSSHCSL